MELKSSVPVLPLQGTLYNDTWACTCMIISISFSLYYCVLLRQLFPMCDVQTKVLIGPPRPRVVHTVAYSWQLETPCQHVMLASLSVGTGIYLLQARAMHYLGRNTELLSFFRRHSSGEILPGTFR
jgi:hypothetical protein